MEKVKKEGFETTNKIIGGVNRVIVPNRKFADRVDLDIIVDNNGELITETHNMFIYTKMDIIRFCGNSFKIVDIVKTNSWQIWYKLIRL
jgi:hypothetical protein